MRFPSHTLLKAQVGTSLSGIQLCETARSRDEGLQASAPGRLDSRKLGQRFPPLRDKLHDSRHILRCNLDQPRNCDTKNIQTQRQQIYRENLIFLLLQLTRFPRFPRDSLRICSHISFVFALGIPFAPGPSATLLPGPSAARF